MEKSVDFFLLTILKNDVLHANVYSFKEQVVEDIKIFSQDYAIRLFELSKSVNSSFDLVIARRFGKFVVCLGPKVKISDDDPNLIKCNKKEIDVEDFLSV